jgi:hypothetical protein
MDSNRLNIAAGGLEVKHFEAAIMNLQITRSDIRKKVGTK